MVGPVRELMHDSRERVNNKSILEEYKIWVLAAEAYVYVVQFRLYQGAKKEKQVASSTKSGFGKNVLQLMECLTPAFSFDILFRIFSSGYPPWS